MIYLENFLEKMSAENSISQNTFDAYRRDLVDLIRYLQVQELEVQNITAQIITNYLASRTQNKARSTVARKISAIRQFLGFLHEMDILSEAVQLSSLRSPKSCTTPKSLYRQEIDELLRVAEADASALGLRTYALLHLIYSSGMRISEVLNLKLNDVLISTYCNLSEISSTQIKKSCIIKGKGAKERIIVLTRRARQALANYLKVKNLCLPSALSDLSCKSQILFLSASKSLKIQALSRQNVWLMFKKIAVVANIDPKKLSPHKIRHSFATHMLENGVDIRVLKEILGHESIITTQLYTHLATEAMREAMLQHPLADAELFDIIPSPT